MSKTNKKNKPTTKKESFQQQESKELIQDVITEETTQELTSSEEENKEDSKVEEINIEESTSLQEQEESVEEAGFSVDEKFLVIKVDVSDLENPIFRIEATQEEMNQTPDVYFTNSEQAKRYAQNELLELKDKMETSIYYEAYWLIENFS